MGGNLPGPPVFGDGVFGTSMWQIDRLPVIYLRTFISPPGIDPSHADVHFAKTKRDGQSDLGRRDGIQCVACTPWSESEPS